MTLFQILLLLAMVPVSIVCMCVCIFGIVAVIALWKHK